MSPSTPANDPQNNNDQQTPINTGRSRIFGNLQINQFTGDPKFFLPTSLSPATPAKSVTSSEHSQKSGSSRRSFFNRPFDVNSKEKKYTLNYLPNGEIKRLVHQFDSILPKVERRQRRAAENANKPLKAGKELLKQYLSEEEPINQPITFEDTLIRKHVRSTDMMQAQNRDWKSLYTVLEGSTLSFYKDENYRLQNWHYRNEKSLDLKEGTLIIETSSKKRPYLIRVISPDGNEYMLQCKTIEDWARWLAELNIAVRRQSPNYIVTTPYGSSFASTPRKSTGSAFSMPATPKSPMILINSKNQTAPSTPIHKSVDVQSLSSDHLSSLVTSIVEQPYERGTNNGSMTKSSLSLEPLHDENMNIRVVFDQGNRSDETL